MTDQLEVEHLCDFDIHFRPVEVITDPSGGTRLHLMIDHGTASGPLLRGDFVSGGDWVVVGADGIGRLDVRATLRADDGSLVYVTNTGRAVLDDEARARFLAGELIGAEAYIRSAPLFVTDSETYGWLNGVVTVAVNEIALDRVRYRIHRVR